MMVVDSLPTLAERMRPEVTVGSYPGLQTAKQRRFQSEEVVSEPNRGDADQTGRRRANGTSNTLRIHLGQFLLSAPLLANGQEFFQAMQKWEGHVTQVGADTFTARIVRIVGEGPDQEAEIYKEEVASDDHALIEPGAVFYWSIGYLDRPSGRLRASIIRFRRLPVWSKHELENAEAKADNLKGLLNVD